MKDSRRYSQVGAAKKIKRIDKLEASQGVSFILVDSTLDAYHALARYWRTAIDPLVVAGLSAPELADDVSRGQRPDSAASGGTDRLFTVSHHLIIASVWCFPVAPYRIF